MTTGDADVRLRAVDNHCAVPYVLASPTLQFAEYSVAEFRDPDAAGVSFGAADRAATATAAARRSEIASQSFRHLLLSGDAELADSAAAATQMDLHVEHVAWLAQDDHLHGEARMSL